MKLSSVSFRSEDRMMPASIGLKSVGLRLKRSPGPLRQQILDVLNTHGRPLRWAITAVSEDVLSIEAVLLVDGVSPL